ncbi:Swt1 family HEPN domain-containing protein [Glutamicibacter protophormiae]|uniref:Swt1 family HEPN domain-containing protein n=1 Tax=Glutamicibacter protophormiae TaxID=37930 RepID=UPI002A82AEFD|nr:Swt1 family HEPN domain-containing protein [Glutamicibacter protophormiae]WPR64381.1 Swt1 family HEPN domain-containing protein [Glutamicibacter protophormiae]WPR67874.1 Swt1 family HEPN domain-containing protein [Glutamicibacter protophormiae]
MALSNIDRVGAALDVLAQALEPFIERVLSPHLPIGVSDWTSILAVKDGIEGKQYSPQDPQAQLRVLTEPLGSLGYAFNRVLSRGEQNLASELRGVRDSWAHRKLFSADDTYRALDTIERLLRAVGAASESDSIRKSRLDVQRATYAEETRRDTRAASKMPDLGTTDLLPWGEVLKPHADIASNDFARAEFAADLHQVSTGAEESSDYNDPVEFFARTYLTDGLKALLTLAVKRVSGDPNAAPVINLQTTFGGGKTHSMLAVWHLFSGRPLTDYPQGVQNLLSSFDSSVVRKPIKKVAIVGNELPPGQSWQKSDGTVIHTLWGELAWQLGGAEGYSMVADSDRTGTNPGTALRDVLMKYSPALILIDEWVAYARGLYGDDSLVGGTFETQFTFAQLLTEAVKAIPGVLLLVSIPASDVRRDSDAPTSSDLEVGGANGRAALERLQNVVSRVAQNWTPASSTESFEIVKRRLFQEPDANAQRLIDATVERFFDFYIKNIGELPRETKDPDYKARLRAAFPIHPELFDRLYGDWSTLERFQRTRGVLRLMSAVVHALYSAGDDSPLIMPGSLPLDSAAVRDEITGYLDDAWKAIIDKDIDGAQSTSVQIDREKELFGRRALTRRIARATFMGSAATLQSQHKGIERKRVFLGVAMPGDTIGNFGSAMGLLGDRSTYLYADRDRYWFDRQPSLNRKAAERADAYGQADVWGAVVDRLRKTEPRQIPEFSEILIAPYDTTDVAESEQVRLVIAHPEFTHENKAKGSTARGYAEELVTKRGMAPRVNANTVVVLAADGTRWPELESAIRQHLAWTEILRDKDSLDLTQGQVAEVGRRIDSLNQTVIQRIRETWIWTLYPEQADGSQPFRIAVAKADGANNSIVRHAGERLRKTDVVIVQSSPQSVVLELRNHLRSKWNDGRISLGELWEYHTRYPYLARFRDKRVLLDAVSAVFAEPAWLEVGFAVAEGYDADTGDFIGLRIPLEDPPPSLLTDSVLLVSPALASSQRAREKSAALAGASTRRSDDNGSHEQSRVSTPGTENRTSTEATPSSIPNARYKGTIDLKPTGDLGAQLKMIAEELLVHLQTADPDTLEIHIAIDAGRRAGFSDAVVRTVRENGTNLGLSTNKFESI